MKKYLLALTFGIMGISSTGCIDPCRVQCALDHINATHEFAKEINPGLADAYLNPDNPYYNGGQAPVDGPWNHGNITSFEKRVLHFYDRPPECDCP